MTDLLCLMDGVKTYAMTGWRLGWGVLASKFNRTCI